MLKATICTIGDEILIGQIVDTNSSEISLELNKIGVKVIRMLSVSDEESDIYSSITKALEDSDIVISTGGLGPTKDDITKRVLTRIYESNNMVSNRDQLNIIEDIFRKRGMEVTEINRLQAEVPEGCEVLLNRLGTAPGMIFRFNEERYAHKPTLYSLPGVPYEAIALLPRIIEDISKYGVVGDILHRTIVTFGVPESVLAQRLDRWEDLLPHYISLAYLPNPSIGIRLRLSIYGAENYDNSIQEIEKYALQLKEMLSDCLYGEGEDTLESVIGRLLSERKAKVATAESCTGGKIASMITSISGSSEWFEGSVIAYQNEVKEQLLKVSNETIERYGAVSAECVREMALGVKNLMNTDFAIATSGIAGPTGGSDEKPVGLVWIAVAFRDKISKTDRVEVRSFFFNGDRERNIDRFASNALNFLRLKIIEN